MITEIRREILDDFVRLHNEGKSPSEILRIIFNRHGEIAPSTIADYYTEVYGTYVMDVLPYLSAWWHDNSSDISDLDFDKKIRRRIQSDSAMGGLIPKNT